MTSYTEPKSTTDPGQQYVIDQLIPEGLTVLSGPAKSRKSIICQQLCLEVSLGTKALGQFDVVAGSAIHVTTDDTEAGWLQRLEKMKDYHGVDSGQDSSLYAMFNPSFGENHNLCEWVVETKRRIPNLRLVVIDPFRPKYAGHSASESGKTLVELGRIAKQEHMAAVLVSPEGKSAHAGITDAADVVISKKRTRNMIMGEITVKTRTGDSRYSLTFNPETFITAAEAVVS